MDNYEFKALKYTKIVLLFSIIMFIIFLAIYIYTDKIVSLLLSLTFLSISFLYIFIYKLYKSGKIHFNKMNSVEKKAQKQFLLSNLLALLLIIIALYFITNFYLRLFFIILFIVFIPYNINMYNHKLYYPKNMMK